MALANHISKYIKDLYTKNPRPLPKLPANPRHNACLLFSFLYKKFRTHNERREKKTIQNVV
jgi:hypothetical protein